MTFYSVSAVIGCVAEYKRLMKYNNNNNNNNNNNLIPSRMFPSERYRSPLWLMDYMYRSCCALPILYDLARKDCKDKKKGVVPIPSLKNSSQTGVFLAQIKVFSDCLRSYILGLHPVLFLSQLGVLSSCVVLFLCFQGFPKKI